MAKRSSDGKSLLEHQSRPWPAEEEIAKARAANLDRNWCGFSPELLAGHAKEPPFPNAHDWEGEWNEAGTLLRCKICGRDGT